MNDSLLWLLSIPAALFLLYVVVGRVRLSLAKHLSLAGHPRLAKRLARAIPRYAFDAERFFAADGAPPSTADRRRQGFERLAAGFRTRSPRSIETLSRLVDKVSDVGFIGRYRVPFPFSPRVRERLHAAVLVERSAGAELIDLDGNRFIDLTGAYGVNVFGTERYKDWIREGSRTVEGLGPVLGPYHPVVESCVDRIRRVSGLDEVSFHMSGTEAVMQAVRLARFHTGRSHVVRFAGAYHGWWDDVQPGVGNPARPGKVHTLAELSERALAVIRRRRDIACVLVNPLQALHPNANAPGDGSLVGARRRAGLDRPGYTAWLKALREACDANGVALIFDEVFVGFRVARGGAQEYFGVSADMVTYGKTLGGGLPVGVLCGRSALMRRYRSDRPADVCFARGTFNSHPYVLGAMNAFLEWLDSEEASAIYEGLDERWHRRFESINRAFAAADLPIATANFSSIATLLHEQPSRYNWMLQFYLNAEGLMLPWTGTGRLIFPISFADAEFDSVVERFVRAGSSMRDDGWWATPEGLDGRSISRAVLTESLRARFGAG